MAYREMNEGVSPQDKTGTDPHHTSAEKKDVKMVLDLYATGKKVREEHDTKWDTYKKFYKGDQWLQKRPSYKSNPNINIIRSTLQTVLPILTDTSPGFDVGAREPSDYKFSDVLSKAIKTWWERSGMDHTIVEVIMDALMYDAGILKCVWDSEAEEGLGDIRCMAIDPKCIYVPRDAEDFDTKCAWVIQKLYMSVGELKRRFPDKAEYIDAASGTNSEQSIEDKGGSGEIVVVSPTDKKSPMLDETKDPSGGDIDSKQLEVLECWLDDYSVEEYELEKDDGKVEKGFKRKYPTGKVVTVLADKRLLLQAKQNPYKDGRKPFVRFIDTIIPRSFWGEGEIEPLIEIQKLINKNMSVLIDWMNMMTNPVWIIDNESGVDPRRLTNQIGAIITKNKGSEVKREQAPSMPPQMFELYQSFRALADTISGVHDVTQGRNPGGVTAAEAINELQEAAQTRIRLKERNLQVSLTQLGYLVVSRVLQYYNEPRVIKISGESEIPDYMEFYVEEDQDGMYSMSKRDWKFDPTTKTYFRREWEQPENPSKGTFDIVVKSGTSLPFQKSRMDQLARMMYKDGLIDQEEVLATMDWPRSEEVMRRMKEEKESEMKAQQAQQPPPGAK